MGRCRAATHEARLEELKQDIPWDGRCHGCFLLPAFCICASVPRFDTGVQLHIVRHVREHRKTTHSARLARQALSRCEILDYGDRDAPLQVDDLPSSGYLLFPESLDQHGKPDPEGPPVHNLSSWPPPADLQNLVILDGTWSQARRMSHRLQPVASWPRVSFTEVAPRARIRRPRRSVRAQDRSDPRIGI